MVPLAVLAVRATPRTRPCLVRWRSAVAGVAGQLQGVVEATPQPFSAVPGPRELPYLGSTLRYTYGRYKPHKFHEAIRDLRRQYGDIFKQTINGQTVVHVFDPDDVMKVYQTDGRTPHIRPLVDTTQMFRDQNGFSPGLGNINGEKWFSLRTSIRRIQLLNSTVMGFLPHVNEVMDDFMQTLDDSLNPLTAEPPDFSGSLKRWKLESAVNMTLERRLGLIQEGVQSPFQRIIDCNERLLDAALTLRFSVPWFKLFSTPLWRTLCYNEAYIFRDAGPTLIQEAIVRLQQETETGNLDDNRFRYLRHLLAGDKLELKDVMMLVLSPLADGLITTVPTLHALLYCLATNPEQQDALYREICEVVPLGERHITSNMLNELRYLKGCIKETLRLFPLGSEVSRIPDVDLVLSNYHVPAGTLVDMNTNLILRDPKYIDDPDNFLPERWLRLGSDSHTNAAHPYFHLPFSTGPRICPGKRFSELEMQVMVTQLLRRYTIEWRHHAPMNQNYRFLMEPDVTPRFAFIKRK